MPLTTEQQIKIMELESEAANVRAARMANQLKVAQLGQVIDRMKKDIEISLAKEAEIQNTIREKEGMSNE